MTYELNNAEKISIVEQHIKNLEFSRYNLQTTLLAEQALTSPDTAVIMNAENRIAEIDAKKAALTTELASLQAAGE